MSDATKYASIRRERLERDLFSDEGWWLGMVQIIPDEHLRVQLGARTPGQEPPTTLLSVTDARRLAGILLALAMEAEDLSE